MSNGVNSTVECGTDEVVHRGIHYDENFAAVAFDVEDASQKHARGTDDGAARFEQQMAAERANLLRDCLRVVVNLKGLLFYVAHADTAPEVHIRKLHTCRYERLHEGRNAFDSATIGGQAQDLRADVHADSLPRNRARTRAIEVETLGAVPINSEFVAMMARCNVAMPASLNVRVHTQCGCSLAAEAGGFFR